MSYEEQVSKMKWSFSRLSNFEHCKYCFFLQYILKDDELYLPEGNYWAENGSAVHETLEKIFRGELPIAEANEYYKKYYKENVFYKAKPETMSSTFEACQKYFEEVDFSWLEYYEILGVELKVDLVIEGYKFIGYIDLLLRRKDNGRIILLDHKSGQYFFTRSGEVKKNMEHSFYNYRKQMYLYSNAVKEMFGQFPDVIVWNHFKDGGKFSKILFNKDDYDEAMKWMIDTIHAVEKEEIFPPTLDFFYCVNLCSFRRSCEYRMKEFKVKSKY